MDRLTEIKNKMAGCRKLSEEDIKWLRENSLTTSMVRRQMLEAEMANEASAARSLEIAKAALLLTDKGIKEPHAVRIDFLRHKGLNDKEIAQAINLAVSGAKKIDKALLKEDKGKSRIEQLRDEAWKYFQEQTKIIPDQGEIYGYIADRLEDESGGVLSHDDAVKQVEKELGALEEKANEAEFGSHEWRMEQIRGIVTKLQNGEELDDKDRAFIEVDAQAQKMPLQNYLKGLTALVLGEVDMPEGVNEAGEWKKVMAGAMIGAALLASPLAQARASDSEKMEDFWNFLGGAIGSEYNPKYQKQQTVTVQTPSGTQQTYTVPASNPDQNLEILLRSLKNNQSDSLHSKLDAWLEQNQNPTDTQINQWASDNDYNVNDVKAELNRMAAAYASSHESVKEGTVNRDEYMTKVDAIHSYLAGLVKKFPGTTKSDQTEEGARGVVEISKDEYAIACISYDPKDLNASQAQDLQDQMKLVSDQFNTAGIQFSVKMAEADGRRHLVVSVSPETIKGLAEGKVPDVTKDNQPGIIAGLLEKYKMHEARKGTVMIAVPDEVLSKDIEQYIQTDLGFVLAGTGLGSTEFEKEGTRADVRIIVNKLDKAFGKRTSRGMLVDFLDPDKDLSDRKEA